jgi:hypothetical protein
MAVELEFGRDHELSQSASHRSAAHSTSVIRYGMTYLQDDKTANCMPGVRVGGRGVVF